MIERKKLIFVVDDNAAIRGALAKYLGGLDFDVVALENGLDVLIKCQEMSPRKPAKTKHKPISA